MLAERVFEAVARFARRGLSKCQPRINQARNPGPNVGGGSKTYRFQQGVGKLLANYSRDLRDLLCRAETIEPQARLMSAALPKLTALVKMQHVRASNPRKDWRHVWQPRNNARRQSPEILRRRPG